MILTVCDFCKTRPVKTLNDDTVSARGLPNMVTVRASINNKFTPEYHMCRTCINARGLQNSHITPQVHVETIEGIIREMITNEVSDQVVQQ